MHNVLISSNSSSSLTDSTDEFDFDKELGDKEIVVVNKSVTEV